MNTRRDLEYANRMIVRHLPAILEHRFEGIPSSHRVLTTHPEFVAMRQWIGIAMGSTASAVRRLLDLENLYYVASWVITAEASRMASVVNLLPPTNRQRQGVLRFLQWDPLSASTVGTRTIEQTPSMERMTPWVEHVLLRYATIGAEWTRDMTNTWISQGTRPDFRHHVRPMIAILTQGIRAPLIQQWVRNPNMAKRVCDPRTFKESWHPMRVTMRDRQQGWSVWQQEISLYRVDSSFTHRHPQCKLQQQGLIKWLVDEEATARHESVSVWMVSPRVVTVEQAVQTIVRDAHMAKEIVRRQRWVGYTPDIWWVGMFTEGLRLPEMGIHSFEDAIQSVPEWDARSHTFILPHTDQAWTVPRDVMGIRGLVLPKVVTMKPLPKRGGHF